MIELFVSFMTLYNLEHSNISIVLKRSHIKNIQKFIAFYLKKFKCFEIFKKNATTKNYKV